jgi:hypothetical protein
MCQPNPNPFAVTPTESRFATLPPDRTDVVSKEATNVCRTPENHLWQNFPVAINGKTSRRYSRQNFMSGDSLPTPHALCAGLPTPHSG